MLSHEARPPPEADFHDAFQKLKHAFNLLVRFHFLFPTSTVVQSMFGLKGVWREKRLQVTCHHFQLILVLFRAGIFNVLRIYFSAKLIANENPLKCSVTL